MVGSSRRRTLAREVTSVARARRVFFAAGEDPGGFEGVVAGEEEGAEDGTSLSVVELGGDVGEVLKHGSVEIEGVVLLGEVADLAAVAVFDDAGVGVFDVGEQAQGGGFPAPL